MMINKKINKITITVEEYFKCVDFARKSITSNLLHYSDRNQFNIHKIFNDIIIGKIGEFGVYNYIKRKGKVIEEPDIKVYEINDKSFDSDLKYDDFKIHVKSQSIEQSDKFGVSWSFHTTDPLIIKPDLNDLIFFCKVNGLNVDILVYGHAKEFISYLKEPKKETLKNFKKVFYYQTIIDKFFKK